MMWGRILQILCAGWLAISPFALSGYGAPSMLVTITDVVCAAVVALLAAVSYHRRVPQLHLATVIPALWLIGTAILKTPSPPPPIHQSGVITGLLLLLLVLVPTHASSPPRGWDAYNDRYRSTAR
jgi:hypothetical protein